MDDRKHADLAAGCELIMDEIHSPGLVDLARIHTTLARFGLHAPLRRFVTQLQA
jgi:hypothetical protein